MERMIEYIKKLSEVNTDGIEPLMYIFDDGENVFREDVITNENAKDELLENAPLKENDMFVVPKTV